MTKMQGFPKVVPMLKYVIRLNVCLITCHLNVCFLMVNMFCVFNWRT